MGISSEDDAKERHGLFSSWYFEINMPLFYGEGATAFLRLQETIMSRSSDLSLLAWEHEIKDNPIPRYDLLATLPSQFGACSNISRRHATILRTPNCLVTHDGVQIQPPVVFNNK